MARNRSSNAEKRFKSLGGELIHEKYGWDFSQFCTCTITGAYHPDGGEVFFASEKLIAKKYGGTGVGNNCFWYDQNGVKLDNESSSTYAPNPAVGEMTLYAVMSRFTEIVYSKTVKVIVPVSGSVNLDSRTVTVAFHELLGEGYTCTLSANGKSVNAGNGAAVALSELGYPTAQAGEVTITLSNAEGTTVYTTTLAIPPVSAYDEAKDGVALKGTGLTSATFTVGERVKRLVLRPQQENTKTRAAGDIECTLAQGVATATGLTRGVTYQVLASVQGAGEFASDLEDTVLTFSLEPIALSTAKPLVGTKLSVSGVSGEGLTYQWQMKKPDETVWTDIENKTDSTFTVTQNEQGCLLRVKVAEGADTDTAETTDAVPEVKLHAYADGVELKQQTDDWGYTFYSAYVGKKLTASLENYEGTQAWLWDNSIEADEYTAELEQFIEYPYVKLTSNSEGYTGNEWVFRIHLAAPVPVIDYENETISGGALSDVGKGISLIVTYRDDTWEYNKTIYSQTTAGTTSGPIAKADAAWPNETPHPVEVQWRVQPAPSDEGGLSDVADITIPARPTPPAGLVPTVSAGPDSITVTGYDEATVDVAVSKASDTALIPDGVERDGKITGLDEGTAYRLWMRVRASNANKNFSSEWTEVTPSGGMTTSERIELSYTSSFIDLPYTPDLGEGITEEQIKAKLLANIANLSDYSDLSGGDFFTFTLNYRIGGGDQPTQASFPVGVGAYVAELELKEELREKYRFGVPSVFVSVIPFELTADNLFVSLDDDLYDKTEKTLTVTTVHEGKTYTLDQSTDCTVSVKQNGASATLVNAGTYDVTVTGQGNYKEGATKTVTIRPRALAVTVAAQSRVYDGTTSVACTASYVAGREPITGDTVTVTVSDATASKNAGTDKPVSVNLSIEGADASNYTVTQSGETTVDILQRELTAVPPTLTGLVYGESTDVTDAVSTNVSDWQLQGVIDGDAVSLNLSGLAATLDSPNAGERMVTFSGVALTGADVGNYVLAAMAKQSVTVGKAAAVIDVSGVNRTYTYNGKKQVVTGATLNHSESELAYSNNTFTDVSEGNGKQVTITAAASTNYYDASETVTLVVNPYALTDGNVTVTPDSTVYNAQNKQLTVQVALNGASHTMTDSDCTVTVTKDGASATVNGAGAYTVTVTGKGNFSGTVQKSVTIAQAPLTVVPQTFASVTYTGAAIDLPVTQSQWQLEGDKYSRDVSIDLTNATAKVTKDYIVGTHPVEIAGVGLSGADAPNFTITGIKPATVEITRAQTVIDVSGVNRMYTYNGSMQSVVTGATLNHSETVPSYANNTFTDVPKNGKQTVTISAKETANYTAAETTVEIVVNKATTVIDTSGVNRTYTDNGKEQVVTGATLNHAETTPSYTYNTFTNVPKNGQQTVTISAEETTNYTAAETTVEIVVNKASTVIDVSSVQRTYTYNGSEQSVVTGATLNHSETAPSYSYNTFKDVPVGGKQTVTISAEETTNYTEAQTTVDITVNKASAVIDTSGVQRSYTYNGSEQTITGATLTFGKPGATLTYSNNTFTDVPGSGEQTVTVTAPESENFRETSVEVTVAIGPYALKKGDVSISLDSTVYDGQEKKPDVKLNALPGSFAKDRDYTVSVAQDGAPATPGDAGTYSVTVTGKGNFTGSVQESVTIAPRALEVTVTAKSRVYDGTQTVLCTTAYVAGKTPVSGDDVTVGAAGETADRKAGAGKPVSVTLTLSGADASNYTVTKSGKTTVDILRKELTAVPEPFDGLVYTGKTGLTLHPEQWRLTGALSGDSVVLDLSRASATLDNAGAGNRTVTFSGVRLTGTDAGNYELAEIPARNVTVAKAAAVIDVSGVNRTYTYTGKLQTVDLSKAKLNHAETTIDHTANTFTTVAEGNGKVITLTAEETANYTEAKASITLSVSKAKAPQITWPSAAEIIYGQSLNDSVLTGGSTELGRFAWRDGTQTPKAGLAQHEMTFTPNDPDNYAWNEAELTQKIGLRVVPRAVTVTVNDATKIYSAADPAWTAEVEGVLPGESIDFTFTRDAGEHVGTYDIRARVSPQENYDVKAVKGTLTIVPKSLDDVTVDPIGKQLYTGKGLRPKPRLRNGNTELIEGLDYTLSYRGNVGPGRGEIIVTGKGNYTGERTIPFDIVVPELEQLKDALCARCTGGTTGIVYTDTYHLTDYELLDVPGVREDLSETRLLMVRATGDEPEARLLMLSGTQLKALMKQRNVELLAFENGGMTAVLEVSELLTGDVAKLAVMALERDRRLTSGDFDLSMEREATLTAAQLRKLRFELRIAPQTQDQPGHEVSVWLRCGDVELELTPYLTTLQAAVTADGLTTDEDRERFVQQYDLCRIGEADEPKAVSSALMTLPDDLIEADGRVNGFALTMLPDGTAEVSVWPALPLERIHFDALLTTQADGGRYLLMEKPVADETP